MGLVVPTVKMSSNSALAERHPGWIDFDAGALLRPGGVGDPESLADRLLELILEVASGRPTAAERRDDAQLAFWKRGVTL
jgi:altronate hydrolase